MDLLNDFDRIKTHKSILHQVLIMTVPLPACLQLTPEDAQLLLVAQSHIGTKNVDSHMLPYIWKVKDSLLDGLS